MIKYTRRLDEPSHRVARDVIVSHSKQLACAVAGLQYDGIGSGKHSRSRSRWTGDDDQLAAKRSLLLLLLLLQSVNADVSCTLPPPLIHHHASWTQRADSSTMERIQSTRFSFRRKGSKNKDKEAKERDATVDFDYDTLSYLRLACAQRVTVMSCWSLRFYYPRQEGYIFIGVSLLVR